MNVKKTRLHKATPSAGEVLGRLIGHLIIGLIIGILFALVVDRVSHKGYLVTWEYLDAAPPNTLELVASREWSLYVRTATDLIYVYDRGAGAHWRVSEVPEDIAQNWESGPCRFTGHEFSFFSNPPDSVLDCIWDEGTYADFYNKHIYILDEKGDLWVWENLVSGMGNLMYYIALPVLGGGVGLVVVIVKTRET